ncbi:TPA: hypothetical protein DDZ86_03490 [Candidatus Dependentiae bacterium]|nr:MAG: Undecaprenyl-diphosphatase [candidate division TM6 bacterium GW2011_GWF2_43_87]HBL98679.1 hypothetical protein [Candidatus Dependentiae bacterium]
MVQLYLCMQILLESLPISSSGHLHLLGFEAPWYIDFFAHGPTAVMLLIYFAGEWSPLLDALTKSSRTVWRWAGILGAAEGITALFFLLARVMPQRPPLVVGFFCTALLLLSLKRVPLNSSSGRSVKWSDGLWLGMAQGVSLVVPGVSRLAVTYVIGRWLGFSARQAFRFSCALQVPLFGGAALLGLAGVIKTGQLGAILGGWGLPAMLAASVGAYLLLWVVEMLMVRETLWYLGIYMIAPMVAALLWG